MQLEVQLWSRDLRLAHSSKPRAQIPTFGPVNYGLEMGLGITVQGLGVRGYIQILGLRFQVECLGLNFYGLGFKIWGLGLGV